MTIHVVSQRKVVEVGWDTSVVLGDDVSVEVSGQEKRDVPNDGTVDLFFPTGYTGTVEVTVLGSHEGSENGSIDVS